MPGKESLSLTSPRKFVMQGFVNRASVLILVFIVISCSLFGQSAKWNSNSEQKSAVVTDHGSSHDTMAGMPNDDHFVIGKDDILTINVWKEPDVSRSLPVRSDGKISLPLVGEVQAAGLTPLELEQNIVNKLQNYITEPEVTVMVQQINSQKFNILGQVAKPGSYSLTLAVTVLDAIAAAGGFRDFAKKKGVYVLRQNPNGGESRIPFNYKDVIKGKNPQQNIRLEPRDTVVVP
jgi:polysaccharide export outer membrane protein